MPCPCCSGYNPCTSLSEVDWKVALDVACWGGTVWPGRLIVTSDNGDGVVTDLDIPDYWTWSRNDQLVHKFGEPGRNGSDFRKFSCAIFYGPTLGGSQYTDQSGEVWFFNNDGRFEVLDIHYKTVNASSCLVYGHIGVENAFTPYTTTNDWTSAQLQQVYNYSMTWRWQATVSGGSVGGISIVPVAGLKNYYTGVIFQDGSLEQLTSTAIPFGPTPEVTITLAP